MLVQVLDLDLRTKAISDKGLNWRVLFPLICQKASIHAGAGPAGDVQTNNILQFVNDAQFMRYEGITLSSRPRSICWCRFWILACGTQNTPKPVHGFSNSSCQADADLLVFSKRALQIGHPTGGFCCISCAPHIIQELKSCWRLVVPRTNVFLHTTNTNMITAIE
jgi:hypothetical protein